MNGSCIHATLAAVLLASGLGMADYGLALSTDKEVYLKYQPVYLDIDPVPGEKPVPLDQVALAAGDVVLEITAPDGSTFEYQPPVTACRIGEMQGVADKSLSHTLIISRGRVVTGEPGTYSIQLFDSKYNRLSRAKKFDVVEPSLPVDKQAAELIARNPGQYAFFLYLEGGDHLADGLDIAEKVAETGSSYSPSARSTLAINYSQSFAHGRDGKPRGRDLKKAEKYLLAAYDQVDDLRKGKMLLSMGQQFGKDGLTPSLKGKLKAVQQKWSGRKDLQRNDAIREILSY